MLASVGLNHHTLRRFIIRQQLRFRAGCQQPFAAKRLVLARRQTLAENSRRWVATVLLKPRAWAESTGSYFRVLPGGALRLPRLLIRPHA